MIQKLKDIAAIRSGIHLAESDTGNISYLQTKHFDNWGQLIVGAIDTYIQVDNNTSKHILTEGDIILTGKGNRIFAWCYQSHFGEVVASSIFFVIRPTQQVLPEYLTHILNLPQSIEFLKKLSGGNSIPSFRKSELEEFEVPVLPLHIQHQIIAINETHVRELVILDQLKEKMIQRYKALVNHILTLSTTTIDNN